MKKGRSRRLGTIDLDTGEILEEGMQVWVKGKVRWHEDWMMVMQEALETLAKDRSFTLEMWRVWSFMVGKLGFENWIILPQVEIAEALGMDKGNVSRSIRKLIDKKVILKGPKIGRTSAYKLNSRYGWKGSLPNLSKDRMGQLKNFYDEAKKIQEREQRI